ncbi:histidine kinase-like ATPase [Russula earlei]|uniref:Histidine kinase-like ATPase n=1 Tax=Russula earlei TaxID=71964 RepID=A0ACC0U673_9AGAM|nr:histidine kinase-like ATPase [Russula earlei]
MKESFNTNVLVIDDEEMVRDNIAEILTPPQRHPQLDSMNKAASILFDKPEPVLSSKSSNIPLFTVDKAANGPEGLEMVKTAIANNQPYAVIFLDMRMPGWDGLETATRIRQYDNKAEIIFVTAYSDRSIDEIVAKAGRNVGYHCKPYATEEIVQIATKAVTDYNRLRNLEKLIEVISSISLEEQQLHPLLRNILEQLADYIETDMALLGKLHEDYSYEKIFSIGAFEEKVNVDELICRIKAVGMPTGNEVVQIGEIVLAKLDDYTIFVVLKMHEMLKTEKLYLLKLFVQNAVKAIRNAQLHEWLFQKEKLAAVGKAVAMVMHDLRPPIMYIKVVTDLMRKENIQSQWLDVLDQCGEQATEIFEDFLDFIKDTAVEKHPVNLQQVIEEGIKLALERNGISKIVIRKNMLVNLVVQGEESKLKRVIMNLVNNAIEALEDHKVIDPSIDITTAVEESGKTTTVIIRDNGPGIPVSIFKTLFEPFVTEQKNKGTGLGLAIVKQYVMAHGGNIEVENNNGAVFTIRLPNG